MFLCMAAMAGIGFLIKYTLIPAHERWIKYGQNVGLYLFGMDRHEWGMIHLIIGFVLLGLLTLHIILHWKVIAGIYNRLIQNKALKKIIVSAFITICSLLIVLPFILNPEVDEIEQGKGRQVPIHSTKREDKPTTLDAKETYNKNNNFETHSSFDASIEVRGFMSLDEVSNKYNVPTNFIKKGINIPDSISDKQKLGWLRKKYDFRMSEVEKIIIDYQEKNE